MSYKMYFLVLFNNIWSSACTFSIELKPNKPACLTGCLLPFPFKRGGRRKEFIPQVYWEYGYIGIG